MPMSASTKLMGLVVVAAALVACSGGGGTPAEAAQAAGVAAPLPPGVFRMSRAQIMDPSGFEKPVLAATVLVPASDWVWSAS